MGRLREPPPMPLPTPLRLRSRGPPLPLPLPPPVRSSKPVLPWTPRALHQTWLKPTSLARCVSVWGPRSRRCVRPGPVPCCFSQRLLHPGPACLGLWRGQLLLQPPSPAHVQPRGTHAAVRTQEGLQPISPFALNGQAGPTGFTCRSNALSRTLSAATTSGKHLGFGQRSVKWGTGGHKGSAGGHKRSAGCRNRSLGGYKWRPPIPHTHRYPRPAGLLPPPPSPDSPPLP